MVPSIKSLFNWFSKLKRPLIKSWMLSAAPENISKWWSMTMNNKMNPTPLFQQRYAIQIEFSMAKYSNFTNIWSKVVKLGIKKKRKILPSILSCFLNTDCLRLSPEQQPMLQTLGTEIKGRCQQAVVQSDTKQFGVQSQIKLSSSNQLSSW